MSVELEGVRKRYGPLEVLRGVTLRAAPGEAVGLVGPNGAGKTTTLRVLAALARPTGGVARVCGWDVARHPDQVRRRVGFVAEQSGVYGRLSGLEILEYFGVLYGLARSEARRRAEQLVSWLGMEKFCGRPASTYSRGMRQRLHVARALLHDPEVLLLDEPTTGLDASTCRLVREAVRSLARQGRCVVLATHSAEEASHVCSRVVHLAEGTVQHEEAAHYPLRATVEGHPVP
ncbi:MAG: ABC transporter ATP-binding protein [Armatimonadota bacterium]|nr:ABC transporter ATP-binding protein [Armatimonadota bacterium]MDW8156928.1 ABC transporter ATP-binding protein [Armatimonadota bacterium]